MTGLLLELVLCSFMRKRKVLSTFAFKSGSGANLLGGERNNDSPFFQNKK